MNRKSPPEAPANDSSPSQLGALVWGFLKWSIGLSVAGVLSVSLLVALALAMADAHFGDDEWELFSRGLALLNLQDQQRRGHRAIEDLGEISVCQR